MTETGGARWLAGGRVRLRLLSWWCPHGRRPTRVPPPPAGIVARRASNVAGDESAERRGLLEMGEPACAAKLAWARARRPAPRDTGAVNDLMLLPRQGGRVVGRVLFTGLGRPSRLGRVEPGSRRRGREPDGS